MGKVTRVEKVARITARGFPDDVLGGQAMQEAAEILRVGGLVAFPTETVYGLGADATNPEAVARIYEAKGRPSNNPLIVHGFEEYGIRAAVGDWPGSAAALAGVFWPGPLTLVLPRSKLIPDIVTGGKDTVGIRVPDSPAAQVLLAHVGRPIAAPSANRSTGISPTRAEHVLKDLDGRIDMILDGGPCPIGIESTVLDLTGRFPRVLRPGAITASQIARVLDMEVETPVIRRAESDDMASPGQMELHYAPRTPAIPIEAGGSPRIGTYWASRRFGLLAAGHPLPMIDPAPTVAVEWLDPGHAARELYDTLHRWDDSSLDGIFVMLPPDTDEWRAVRDRLWRATRRWARQGLS